MDCEKFESAMMDELYGELDELTSAAAKRHVAGCARCSALIGGLRATRRLATVPMVDPPADLEERILAAAREARKVVPIRGRLARVVSMAGSWAMRPQTAMAALFLVMIGTSVLLLRGRSARTPASADVTVTERGAPAPVASATSTSVIVRDELEQGAPAASAYASRAAEAKPVAVPTTTPPADLGEDLRAAHTKTATPSKDKDDIAGLENASAPGGVPNNLPPASAPAGGGGGALASGWAAAPPPVAQAQAGPMQKKGELTPFDTALQNYRSGKFEDATRAFDALAPSDANADLWAARSVREGKGCRNAVARFDRVAQRAAGTPNGWDALLEGALCYRAMGDFASARSRLNALLGVDSHKDRARAELDRLNQFQQAQGNIGPAAGAAARPSPKRAAPAEASPAAPPRATSTAVDSAY
jgi:hypothetical protein